MKSSREDDTEQEQQSQEKVLREISIFKELTKLSSQGTQKNRKIRQTKDKVSRKKDQDYKIPQKVQNKNRKSFLNGVKWTVSQRSVVTGN